MKMKGIHCTNSGNHRDNIDKQTLHMTVREVYIENMEV
jgi:hypothetical protein